MIIVDTSVWIDYFNGVDSREADCLDKALGQEIVAIGDLIALEILQGFKSDKHYRAAKEVISDLTQFNMLGADAVESCADKYRKLRKKGITIRKTADVIIASFCIDNNYKLLFSDKDFKPFVDHLGLKPVLQDT